MVRTTNTPALVLKGTAAERATRVARWREEAHRNKPWMRARTRTLILCGLAGVGLIGTPFGALGLGSFYEGAMEALGLLFVASILTLVALSSILASRGPSWIPRLGLAAIAAHTLWQLVHVAWPAAPGSFEEAVGACFGGAMIALVGASQVAFVKLPRHLVWVQLLAWSLLIVAGVTLSLSGREFGFDVFVWSVLLACSVAWSAAYTSIVLTLRLTWQRLVHKTWSTQPIDLWPSLVIYGLAWPTFALLVDWLGNPLGSGSEVTLASQITWSRSDLLLGDSLLLGLAFACIQLFSMPRSLPVHRARRAPHGTTQAE
jgi:hypothetical protein